MFTDRINELKRSRGAAERTICRIHEQWKDGRITDLTYTTRHRELSTLITWINTEIRKSQEQEAA